MLYLYHGSGASGYDLLGPPKEEWPAVRTALLEMLSGFDGGRAVELLSNYPWECFDASNGFGDEFAVLHLQVSPREYSKFVKLNLESETKAAAAQIAHLISDHLGQYIRFVGIEIVRTASELVPNPEPDNTGETVRQALRDSVVLLSSSGPVSALDRLHTALHGYFRKVCDDAGIHYDKDSTLQGLFGLLRQHHPALGGKFAHPGNLATALRSSALVLEALNHYRNRGSLAHSNEELIGSTEAMYMINTGRSVFIYIHDKLKEAGTNP